MIQKTQQKLNSIRIAFIILSQRHKEFYLQFLKFTKRKNVDFINNSIKVTPLKFKIFCFALLNLKLQKNIFDPLR
jgi:hypothetical protein